MAAVFEMRISERIVSATGGETGDFAPIFVVGVLRSGTAFAAGLIANGTDARDRDELGALRFIAERLRQCGGHLENAAVIGEAADPHRMVACQDDAPACVHLGQDLLNFRRLEFAAAMFPQA